MGEACAGHHLGLGCSLGHAEHLQASGLILGLCQPNDAGKVNFHQISSRLVLIAAYPACHPTGAVRRRDDPPHRENPPELCVHQLPPEGFGGTSDGEQARPAGSRSAI